MRVVPQSQALAFTKVRTANDTTASGFAAKVATVTKPSGSGVIDMTSSGCPLALLVMLFGAGAENNTFDGRIIGWRNVGTLWVPTTLWQGTGTLSTAVGVAGQTVAETDRFCDTIATTALYGTAGDDSLVFSPADNTPAHLWVATKGCMLFDFDFNTGSSATNANALVAPY